MKSSNKNIFLINKQSLVVLIFSITLFWVLFFCYFFIIEEFYSYAGFKTTYFSFYSLILGFSIIVIIGLLGFSIRDYLYYMVFHIIFIMNFIPAVILNINLGWNVTPLLLVIGPLLTLWILDRFIPKYEIESNIRNFDYKKSIKLLLIAFVLVLPFLARYQHIDISNLFLENVYDSREIAKSLNNPYIGYVTNPLERYLLPFLFIYFLAKGKKLWMALTFLMIILIYLTTGSLKGYLVYIALMIFMYFGYSQYQKISRLLILFITTFSLELSTYLISGEIFITDYIRRSFFVESLLARNYSEYFNGNFTQYSHTEVASLIGINSEFRSQGTITNWFGNNVLGTGTNASIGSFVEGYFSLGILGLILICLVFGVFVFLVRSCKIEEKYVGITMLGCYVFIMSMIEQAFITQGLWFFIILCLFVMPRKKVSTV